MIGGRTEEVRKGRGSDNGQWRKRRREGEEAVTQKMGVAIEIWVAVDT